MHPFLYVVTNNLVIMVKQKEINTYIYVMF